MTVYILSLVRDSFLYRALYNSTENSHLTPYPQTSACSSNNQEIIAICVFFFFRDGINGDEVIECVVIDNQIGVKA